MNLSAFHRVLTITANQRFLEILNSHLVLFVIPLIHPAQRPIRIRNSRPPSPQTPEPEGVMHLDHIEIHDVTTVHISPTALSIETQQGSFNWKVYDHVQPLDIAC